MSDTLKLKTGNGDLLIVSKLKTNQVRKIKERLAVPLYLLIFNE